MNKTIKVMKVFLIITFIILMCMIMTSCFKETKQQVIEKPIYHKEEISLNLLNQVIYFKENEFREWSKVQDYKYQFSADNDDITSVQYSNSDESEAVLIKIPKLFNMEYDISYITSDVNKYENILNDLNKSNYKLINKTEEEIEYYKSDSKIIININDISNKKIYSINIYKNGNTTKN